MARVENIVPFILKWETGTTGIGLTNEQLFEKAKERGFANDPDDLGGATMCGVTFSTYTAYCSKKRLSTATLVICGQGVGTKGGGTMANQTMYSRTAANAWTKMG